MHWAKPKRDPGLLTPSHFPQVWPILSVISPKWPPLSVKTTKNCPSVQSKVAVLWVGKILVDLRMGSKPTSVSLAEFHTLVWQECISLWRFSRLSVHLHQSCFFFFSCFCFCVCVCIAICKNNLDTTQFYCGYKCSQGGWVSWPRSSIIHMSLSVEPRAGVIVRIQHTAQQKGQQMEKKEKRNKIQEFKFNLVYEKYNNLLARLQDSNSTSQAFFLEHRLLLAIILQIYSYLYTKTYRVGLDLEAKWKSYPIPIEIT